MQIYLPHRRKAFQPVGGYNLEESLTGPGETGGYVIASAGSVAWRAGAWTVGVSDYTLTRFTAALYRAAGECPYTMTGYIFANAAGSPDLPSNSGPLITSSSTVPGSIVTASATTPGTAEMVPFDFSGLALTNGVKYWVAISADSTDATNHLIWVRSTNSTGVAQDADGVSWTSSATTRELKFDTYSS